MRYTGERVVPWHKGVGWPMDHHVARYAWALQFCHGRRVVDLGCGTGYGSFMLSWVADEVIGLDVDAETVCYARTHFPTDSLTFETVDIASSDPPKADVYVAFAVLEHLHRPSALVRQLDTTLLWSVPMFDDSAFHRHVYSPSRAIADFGGDIWYQSKSGYIVPKSEAQFKPHALLGMSE